tara:strand:+ start:339 stop:650 length:312 start_codon:yes stop_codon:yes gene_type:complete
MKAEKKEERKEQPLMNLKVEVDSWKTGSYQRLNWEAMNFIDLEEVFRTILPEEKGKYKNDVVPYGIAETRTKRFMARLKQYILEKTEDDNENFDWSDWDRYHG